MYFLLIKKIYGGLNLCMDLFKGFPWISLPFSDMILVKSCDFGHITTVLDCFEILLASVRARNKNTRAYLDLYTKCHQISIIHT